MATQLDSIKDQFNSGDIKEAKNKLITLLVEEPKNTDAWALLRSLFDDPGEQADCYRQILLIDPFNRQAADNLLKLSSQVPTPYPQDVSVQDDSVVLECGYCGAPMEEMQFDGELRAKGVICLYCGREVELTDSFSPVDKKGEYEQQSWGNQMVKKTDIENRREGKIHHDDFDSLPPEIQELLRILIKLGPIALGEQDLQKLQESGVNLSVVASATNSENNQEHSFDDIASLLTSHSTETVFNEMEYEDDQPSRFPFLFRRKRRPKIRPLTTSEIIKMAGDPLPPDKRRECPNPKCGAVIAKSAKKCSWCGEALD